MFKSYDHFKKATKNVFDKFKANRNIKLSEFRNDILAQTEYNNIHSYANHFVNDIAQANSTSAEIKTISVIIVKDQLIETKVDFIDNEIGLSSAHSFFIAHVKQYVFKNHKTPDIDIKIYEEDFYYIDEGIFELSENHSIQIVRSTGYDLQDTEENKYSEIKTWNSLAFNCSNLSPIIDSRSLFNETKECKALEKTQSITVNDDFKPIKTDSLVFEIQLPFKGEKSNTAEDYKISVEKIKLEITSNVPELKYYLSSVNNLEQLKTLNNYIMTFKKDSGIDKARFLEEFLSTLS